MNRAAMSASKERAMLCVMPAKKKTKA